MKICMLVSSSFPPDSRVSKEIKTLQNEGHGIIILPLWKEGQKKTDEFHTAKIIRIELPKNFLHRAWNYLYFNLFFVKLPWKKGLRETINTHKIDAVHVHDLDLVKTALSLAKTHDIPLVVDLHENFPEAVRVWSGNNNLIEKILYLPVPVWRWKKLERDCLKKADKIITVVEEGREHYVKDCGIPPEKIIVVMNTEDIDEFQPTNHDVPKQEGEFIISYTGLFGGTHRGLDTAIQAMPKVIGEIPNAKLFLIGKGLPRYEKYLKELCAKLKIEDNVVFTGWIDFKNLPAYIAASDVCLVPHRRSGHTDTTIPHKIFQYMLMGKPVVSTDCKPLKRIVGEEKCGIVVEARNPDEMAKAIIELYKNPSKAQKMGEEGRNAVLEKYNWAKDSERLAKVYRGLNDGNKKID